MCRVQMTDVAGPSDKKVEKKIRLGRNYWKLWITSVTSNLGDGVAGIA